jgi:hypothetical protein
MARVDTTNGVGVRSPWWWYALTTIVAIVKAKYSSKAVDANDDNDWIEEVADTWGATPTLPPSFASTSPYFESVDSRSHGVNNSGRRGHQWSLSTRFRTEPHDVNEHGEQLGKNTWYNLWRIWGFWYKKNCHNPRLPILTIWTIVVQGYNLQN